MDDEDQLVDLSVGNKSVDRPDCLPPIRILDLMLLTTAMAFVFMLQTQLRETQPSAFRSSAWLVWGIIAAVPAGIAIASIVWMVNQKRITGRFLIQPGHWILASHALVTTSAYGSSWFFLFRNTEISSPGALTAYFVSHGLAYFASSGLMVWGLFSNPTRWRGVIMAMAISYGISAMTFLANLVVTISVMALAVRWLQILAYIKLAADPICILLLIVAIVVDIKHRTSRDWLHWAGTLVLFLAFGVQPIVQMIVMRYFFDPQLLGA